MVGGGAAGDDEEPGGEIACWIESCDGAPGSDKGFLSEIFGVVRVADVAAKEAVDARFELQREFFECFNGTCGGAGCDGGEVRIDGRSLCFAHRCLLARNQKSRVEG